jgi:hypothetical protein
MIYPVVSRSIVLYSLIISYYKIYLRASTYRLKKGYNSIIIIILLEIYLVRNLLSDILCLKISLSILYKT